MFVDSQSLCDCKNYFRMIYSTYAFKQIFIVDIYTSIQLYLIQLKETTDTLQTRLETTEAKLRAVEMDHSMDIDTALVKLEEVSVNILEYLKVSIYRSFIACNMATCGAQQLEGAHLISMALQHCHTNLLLLLLHWMTIDENWRNLNEEIADIIIMYMHLLIGE